MGASKHLLSKWTPLWLRMGGRRLFYAGTAHACPMCGATSRRLLQSGDDLPVLAERGVVGGMRPADRCPVCNSQSRMRLMRLFLETEKLVGHGPARLLHVAPDLGLVLWLKHVPGLDYLGTDLSPRRYRHVPNFMPADLMALPFDDGAFDVVICSHVLEHVPDDATAMAELFRVTRPGGVTLALTPFATDDRPTDEDETVTDPAERERRFGQWDHVRLYHRDDFVRRLGRAGFDVALWDAFAATPDKAAAANLNPLELLPVARRPA